MSNIITAVFEAGACGTVTSPLFQWDYGQVLQFQGLELPETYEVHFANTDTRTSVTMLGNADGVDIPDACLTSGEPIYAWVFLHTGEDDGETEYTVSIPVISRAEPSDIEPTPVQQDIITQAIAALNSGVTRAETGAASARDSASQAANSAHSAQVQAGAASLSATRAATSATAAAASEANAATSATAAAQSAEEAAEAAEAAHVEYTVLSDKLDEITEDVSAVYITPGLNVTSQGVTFTYDEEHNAIKAYGTAALNRYLLCLNGQNTIATTSTALIQTFEAGTYDFGIAVSGHYSDMVTLRYTYGSFPGTNLVDSVNNPSARVTFTGPAMVGLLMPKNADYGDGEGDGVTYIAITATKVTAVDAVARDAIDGMTVDENTAWN